MDDDIIIQADGDDVIVDEDSPAECCPDPCYLKFPILAGDDDSPFWQGWANLRLKTFQLIENKYFETAVITMILLSSLALVRITGMAFEGTTHINTPFSLSLSCRLLKTFTYHPDQFYKTSCTTWTEYLR